jgi:hypothetical protein
VLLLIFWIAVARLGLAAHDVLLVYAVGGFAWRQQEREARTVLLGDDAPPPVRWGDFLREHHQILGCVLPGNGRTRSERILALAVSTLALLYWKTIFRTPKLSMGSVQSLRSSLWTLVVSKAMQLLMKRLIRFVAARQAKWHSSAGFLDKLQMTWIVLQYWVRDRKPPARAAGACSPHIPCFCAPASGLCRQASEDLDGPVVLGARPRTACPTPPMPNPCRPATVPQPARADEDSCLSCPPGR